MKKALLFLILLSSIALSFNAFADTLYLKNGTQLEGMVVEETDEWIVFNIYGGTVKFQKSEINRITKGPLKVQEPKPSAKTGASKASTKDKKDGVMIPSIPKLDLPTTGWKGELVQRIMKYAERQSNPRKALLEDFSITKLLFWLLEALFVFLVISLFIKLYIRLFGVSIPYGRAALFLFKFNIISNVIVGLFTVVAAAQTGPAKSPQVAFQPGQPIAVAAAILLVLGVFFWLADRDLESGLLKSIGLFIVMLFAYLLSGITFSLSGLV